MSDHPEPQPNALTPIDRFVFSKRSISDAKADCELQLEALKARIDKINENFVITLSDGRGEMTIIDKILDLTHDTEQLKGVAKGLARVADIIGSYDDVNERMQVLNLAKKNFNWFTANFGDFDAEVENALTQLIEKEEQNGA